MNRRQSNEYKYGNAQMQLEDEIKDNFSKLYTNFELIKDSTEDLIFNKVKDNFVDKLMSHSSICDKSIADS